MRNFFILTMLLASCFQTFSTSAQKRIIQGKVFDATSKLPLSGVNVVIKSTTIGTSTGKTGEFSLPISTEKGLLRISCAGFSTIETELVASSDSNYIFYLIETVYDLNTIVITGTRTEKSLKNVPVLTQLISDKQLEGLQATNIQNILEHSLPNINFAKAGFGSRMSMQGLEAKYILFLIDGERLAGEVNGNIDYDRINPNDIERIEVIKGASSSLYGSNAIGGVVNIITKEVKNPIEISLHSKYSKYNDLTSGAKFGLTIGKFTSKTEFEYKTMDGYDLTPTSPYERTVEEFYDYNINQKFAYKINDKLSVKAKAGYYVNERFDTDPIPIHKKYSDFNYQIKADYYYSLSNKLEASWYSDQYQTFDVLELLDDENRRTYSSRFDCARVVNQFNLTDRQSLNTGLEYQREYLFSDRIDGENKAVNDWIFFAQDDIQCTDNLNSVVGFRVNHHSQYGLHFTPQISTMYRLGSFAFRGSYAAGYKAPTLKELYMNYSPVPVIEIHGNEDLKPETSNYFSTSVEYSRSVFHSSIVLYRTDIEDMITEINDLNDTKVWTYMNVSDVRVKGMDVNFDLRLKFGFSIGGSYSFNETKDLTTNNQVWGINKHSGVVKAQYFYKRKNYQLNAGLFGKLFGETNYMWVDELTGKQTDRIMPAHSLWRLMLVHHIYSGIAVTTGIDNIFDYVQTDHITTINPGRRFLIGLSVDIHKFQFVKQLNKKE